MNADDWTGGQPTIVFDHCRQCRANWYFKRELCPYCGAAQPERRVASGVGVVYAVTVVQRAPSAALRAEAPYTIVLVDADEGFRMMAHAAPGIAIGAKVRTRFKQFGGAIIPFSQGEDDPA
jgi:uncharacterized OB-fold protein